MRTKSSKDGRTAARSYISIYMPKSVFEYLGFSSEEPQRSNSKPTCTPKS